MESVTTDKPDASRASDDEHLGSSSTANGFSVIHSYLSKRSYPTCLCMTAFQLVHFQIAYHSSWWSYITQSYEMGLPLMVTLLPVQQQEGTQDCRLFRIATAYCVATLTTTKVQCEGCSTRFVVICSSSDADNWKCAPLVLCIGHLRFCFL